MLEQSPPADKRGGAMQAVALQQIVNANGEGGKELRHDSGYPCPGLPMLTMYDRYTHVTVVWQAAYS